jgi:hypothetical protein
MSMRWLLGLLPLAGALVVFTVVATAGTSAPGVILAVNVLVLLAATVGCMLATASFDQGDYLWRAWALNTLSNGVLVVDLLLFGPTSHFATRNLSHGSGLVSALLSTIANISAVAMVVLVGRAWSVAGLDLQVSTTKRWAAFAASIVVALLIAGPGAWNDLQGALVGQGDALSGLISDLGDIATLAVLAPLVLTALALRGGSLAWPWALLAVSTLGWLLFDGIGTLAPLLHAPGPQLRPLEDAFRALASLATLSAGLLQRRAIEQV